LGNIHPPSDQPQNQKQQKIPKNFNYETFPHTLTSNRKEDMEEKRKEN
jgi:hypothetical protein